MLENESSFVENVDVCVIGAGHAGCEAALACARLGLETVIFTCLLYTSPSPRDP